MATICSTAGTLGHCGQVKCTISAPSRQTGPSTEQARQPSLGSSVGDYAGAVGEADLDPDSEASGLFGSASVN